MEYSFKELYSIIDGDRGKNYPQSNDFYDEGYCLFLNAGNVTKTGWSFNNVHFITQEKDEKLHNGRLSRGDIVITTRGTVGNVVYYDDSIPFDHVRINSGMVILKNRDEKRLLGAFSYYLLTSPYVQKKISLFCSGSAQPQLPIKDFVKIKVEVPSIDKQQLIVNKVSAYDSLIELNNKRIKLLEQMAENLYKEWFVRFRFPGHETAEFENGIPKGWEYKKLFDVAKVTYGYAFSSDLFCDDEALNPVVRIRDVPNNVTRTFTSEPCSDKYRVVENAILVGMDGIFHMCMWNDSRAYLNQRVVEIEAKDNEYSNLMLFYAIYPQVKFWEQTISGTTVAHLGDKHLKKMVVIVPTGDIMSKATELFNHIMIEKNFLFKQNQNLIKQRDLLLPRLMSGKLEV